VPGQVAQELTFEEEDPGSVRCIPIPGTHVPVDACNFAGGCKRFAMPACLREYFRLAA